MQTIFVLQPTYPHDSIEGLWFLPKEEAVSFDGKDELRLENYRGVKWDNPVTQLKMLVKTDLRHRLLQKWVLDQIASHLKTLGRKKRGKGS